MSMKFPSIPPEPSGKAFVHDCLILLKRDDGVKEEMQFLFFMITAEGGGIKEKVFKKLFTHNISVAWLE